MLIHEESSVYSAPLSVVRGSLYLHHEGFVVELELERLNTPRKFPFPPVRWTLGWLRERATSRHCFYVNHHSVPTLVNF